MADAATDVEMAEVKAQAHEGDQTAAAPMENGNAQTEAPAAEEPGREARAQWMALIWRPDTQGV